MSSLGLVDPIAFPQYWDKVRVAGTWSPGLCRVKNGKRIHTWDVKKGKGTVGAKITFTEKPPATFDVEFILWDNGTLGTGHNHFAEWDNFVQLLKYDPTKKTANAVSIFHPALDFADISSVVTTEIGIPEDLIEGDSAKTITVSFLEDYPTPPKNATSSPVAPITSTTPPTGSGNPPPDAPDALQQQIAILLNQAQQ